MYQLILIKIQSKTFGNGKFLSIEGCSVKAILSDLATTF